MLGDNHMKVNIIGMILYDPNFKGGEFGVVIEGSRDMEGEVSILWQKYGNQSGVSRSGIIDSIADKVFIIISPLSEKEKESIHLEIYETTDLSEHL